MAADNLDAGPVPATRWANGHHACGTASFSSCRACGAAGALWLEVGPDGDLRHRRCGGAVERFRIHRRWQR